MINDRDSLLQFHLDRLRDGEESAREALMALTRGRLIELTRVMLRDYRKVRRWEQSDDVLQNALIRLDRALREVAPASARDFYRLATLQIRRELIDLSRRHFGPEGLGVRHANHGGKSTAPAVDPPDPTNEPGRLASWGEFHERVDALPDEEREVFDLVWYQAMTHADAAAVLGVSTKTVQRRWHSACVLLHEALGDGLPGL